MHEQNPSMDELYDAWHGMYKHIGDQMSETIRESKKDQAEMVKMWTEMSGWMGGRMNEMTWEDPGSKELNNLWRNYSMKMARRMNQVMTSGNRDYQRLYVDWMEWSASLGRQMDSAKDSNDAAIIASVQRQWLETQTSFLQRLTEGLDGEEAAMEDLQATWTDCSANMTDSLQRLVESGSHDYKELLDSWTRFSSSMTQRFQGYTDGMEADYQKLYDTWGAYSEEMTNRYTKAVIDAQGTTADRSGRSRKTAAQEADLAASCALDIAELQARVSELEAEMAAMDVADASSRPHD